MFEGKTIAVVVPCHNEAQQIVGVLETMPEYVDCVIVVDDGSTDGTAAAVREYIASAGDGRPVVLVEQTNQGVGRAICNGYLEAVQRNMNIAAVMAGDGQMEPRQLRHIIAPVARDQADYVKINRLYFRRAWEMTPKSRYLGNAFLSMITKIASGYWRVADSQTGYTAISDEAIRTIDLGGIYPGYGYPNDLLVRLNVCNFRVADVPMRPVYGVGERSKMRLWKAIPTMSWLIFKRFCWRMWQKYVIRDFHPLVLFYLAAMVFAAMSAGLFARMIWMWATVGRLPPMNTFAWGFCTTSMIQFALFGMWFDMEVNRELNPLLSTHLEVDKATSDKPTSENKEPASSERPRVHTTADASGGVAGAGQRPDQGEYRGRTE